MDRERTSVYPFVSAPGRPAGIAVERAEGPFLILAGGRKIYDAAGGAIVNNIGHGRAEVAEVAARALERSTYAVPPFATEERIALVERLRRAWLPEGLTRCVFTSGGSESVDAAMRLVRQHFVSKGEPDRWKIIGRERSYHGTTLATLGVGGHEKRRTPFEPLFVDHPKIPTYYGLHKPGFLEEIAGPSHGAERLREAIEREGPETVAAFIAEPVGGSTMGAIVPPDDYWPRIREICSEHGILLVCDEVMTGFGRTGKRFAIDHWGVTPDVLIGGKGLAGGYAPIGGIFTSEAVIAPIAEQRDELMFYTYSAHPMACAVADKVLEILEREALVDRAAAMGRVLAERLQKLGQHANVGDTRGLGLLQAVEFVADKATLAPFPKDASFAGRVVAAGFARGAFFYPGGVDPARDVVCFGPPFIVDESQIDEMVTLLEGALGDTLERLAD